MKKKTRRYLFADYQTIEQEPFDQYHLICDRMFLFVDEHQQSIPLSLAISLQKLGKGLRWVKTTSNNLQTNSYLLSFMLGKLHERLPSDIEFALLSDEEQFDGLISLINRKGRRCLRILSHEFLGGQEPADAPNIELPQVIEKAPFPNKDIAKPQYAAVPSERNFLEEQPDVQNRMEVLENTDNSIRAKAVNVTNWLMRSGNRPAELSLLKKYIALNDPELGPGNAEKIITFMAMSNDIQIENKSVLYNF